MLIAKYGETGPSVCTEDLEIWLDGPVLLIWMNELGWTPRQVGFQRACFLSTRYSRLNLFLVPLPSQELEGQIYSFKLSCPLLRSRHLRQFQVGVNDI